MYPYREFCETCLVRACCVEPCYIVDLIEPVICMNCKENKTCKEICKNVIFYRLDKIYDLSGQMIKHFQESSILYQVMKMKDTERKEL